MRSFILPKLCGICLLFLASSCNNIQDFNQQLEREGKTFRLGLEQSASSSDRQQYIIRMDVQFSSAEEFQSLFEQQTFNYIMNNVCEDFKFLNGSDTISCLNNFTSFNHAAHSISIICLFPKEIEKADEWMLRQNYFLSAQLIQKIQS
jgi:hypothetical protein